MDRIGREDEDTAQHRRVDPAQLATSAETTSSKMLQLIQVVTRLARAIDYAQERSHDRDGQILIISKEMGGGMKRVTRRMSLVVAATFIGATMLIISIYAMHMLGKDLRNAQRANEASIAASQEAIRTQKRALSVYERMLQATAKSTVAAHQAELATTEAHEKRGTADLAKARKARKRALKAAEQAERAIAPLAPLKVSD